VERDITEREFIAIRRTACQRVRVRFWTVIVYLVCAVTVNLGFNAICDKLIVDNLINSTSIRQRFGSRQ